MTSVGNPVTLKLIIVGKKSTATKSPPQIEFVRNLYHGKRRNVKKRHHCYIAVQHGTSVLHNINKFRTVVLRVHGSISKHFELPPNNKLDKIRQDRN